MKSIGWIQIDNTDRNYKFGGSIYNDYSRKVLSKYFRLKTYPISVPITKGNSYMQLPRMLYQLSKLGGTEDVWIRDFYSAVSRPYDKTKGKHIVLIHHIDTTTLSPRLRIFFELYEKIFYQSLKGVSAIVTMSRFWQQQFRSLGFKNVYTIYNPIDFEHFVFSQNDVARFKKKYRLLGKPIVYLGNCRPYKGVKESYEALKHLPVHLVTSGHRHVELPIPNLLLDHKEQFILQKAATVAVAMSQFKEGWSMTVHEAMSVGTPVVGTGYGGMSELLVGGRQIVCTDFSKLEGIVKKLLGDNRSRARLGKSGSDYANQFTKKRFEHDWMQVFAEVLGN